MGKKKASTNLSAKQLYQSAVAAAEASVGSSTLLYVDPRRIRYEHSTIKRQFTGVGGSVEAAYDDIKAGRMRAEQLPPIQVRPLSIIAPRPSLTRFRRCWLGPSTTRGGRGTTR
jgi:hypothetical protein